MQSVWAGYGDGARLIALPDSEREVVSGVQWGAPDQIGDPRILGGALQLERGIDAKLRLRRELSHRGSRILSARRLQRHVRGQHGGLQVAQGEWGVRSEHRRPGNPNSRIALTAPGRAGATSPLSLSEPAREAHRRYAPAHIEITSGFDVAACPARPTNVVRGCRSEDGVLDRSQSPGQRRRRHHRCARGARLPPDEPFSGQNLATTRLSGAGREVP